MNNYKAKPLFFFKYGTRKNYNCRRGSHYPFNEEYYYQTSSSRSKFKKILKRYGNGVVRRMKEIGSGGMYKKAFNLKYTLD